MDIPKASTWSKIKPWLIILSAIPAFLLLVIVFQLVVAGIAAFALGYTITELHIVQEKSPTLWEIINYSIQLLSLLVVVKIYWVKIFKINFVSIGFERPKHAFKELSQGLLLGVGLITSIFLLLLFFKQIEIESVQFPFNHLLFYVFLYLVVGFNEELLFRGYLLGTTMKLANKYVVLILFASLFSFIHFITNDFSLIPVLNIFLAGILLGIYYIHTKRLWFSIGLHISWNFFQGPVFGSNVSGTETEQSLITQKHLGKEWLTGGDFGFEGSLLMTLLLILIILYIEFYFRSVSPQNREIKKAPQKSL
ncbi:CPBP family intramembrane metalloprotease [Prolixibacteraceae bacterium Z1-6]|uniref:CPBP family intramembrane metalloprotease n=1 Tax=Draconibacterium aestuarii TaxID=2998507 RepID=A0A9X3J8U1_9BACT|nr:CPBP family intramembrane metalloprotease [Prolixibacteraceae bacterium Z1-6]